MSMPKAFRDAYRAREFTASRAADKLQNSEATVESLLNGSSWPDLPTIARIERNLRLRFWASQQYAKQPS